MSDEVCWNMGADNTHPQCHKLTQTLSLLDLLFWHTLTFHLRFHSIPVLYNRSSARFLSVSFGKESCRNPKEPGAALRHRDKISEKFQFYMIPMFLFYTCALWSFSLVMYIQLIRPTLISRDHYCQLQQSDVIKIGELQHNELRRERYKSNNTSDSLPSSPTPDCPRFTINLSDEGERTDDFGLGIRYSLLWCDTSR